MRSILRIATSLTHHQNHQSARRIMTTIQRAADFKKMDDYESVAKRVFEFKETEKDCFSPFVLSNSRQGHHSAAYGGLIFAQALAAAENTIDPSMKPHSTHSYFILNVDTKEPISYNVRRARDGKSFATRTVDAVQNGKVAFVLQASFHIEEKDSIVHQSEMPKVPPPEALMSMRDAVPYMKNLVDKGEITPPPAMLYRLKKYDSVVYSDDADLFEMRCTNLGNYYGFCSDKKPHLYFWMRARGDLSNDERLHRYLFAYISDSSLVPTACNPHYSQGFTSTMRFSLDHCVWFHCRPDDLRVDEWMLFEMKSHIASGSRAFVEAKVWRQDGTLLASCHQECLVRTRNQEVWLIAYNSDSTLLGTSISPHYCQNFVPSMLFSLDHCVWFHKPSIKADEWLLFETKSYIAGGSRASIDGKIWRQDGTLIASVHQEALIRSRDSSSVL